MARFDRYLSKKLDRRRFLQVAGLATVAGTFGAGSASLATRGAEPSPAPPARTAVPVPRNAQYGRARGRYPSGRRA